jgi:hypothetical protein
MNEQQKFTMIQEINALLCNPNLTEQEEERLNDEWAEMQEL